MASTEVQPPVATIRTRTESKDNCLEWHVPLQSIPPGTRLYSFGELSRLEQIGALVLQKFISGNEVTIDRVTIKREEINKI